MIQERGASAKRTQADHSRRESLMSSSSQEPRASGKPAAMFLSGSQESGDQFKSSIFKNAAQSGKICEARTSSWISQRLYQ